MSRSPFDYLNSINSTKTNIMIDDESENDYSAYMVNKGLSYFTDTIFIANEMNLNSHLPNKLQYDFLINIVRKRKRFSKWFKPENETDIEVIKKYYDYSTEKARQIISLLSVEQLKEIREKVITDGRTGK